MKVWISKYSLTKGLLEIDGDVSTSTPEILTQTGSYISFYGEGKSWHKSKFEAIAKAEEMRKNKIKSLQKQINKLNKLTFS